MRRQNEGVSSWEGGPRGNKWADLKPFNKSRPKTFKTKNEYYKIKKVVL